MQEIKGLLIDLDGVIYNDSLLIEGAVESIRWLQETQIPFRFITNTTMKSRQTLQKKLESFGISVEEEVGRERVVSNASPSPVGMSIRCFRQPCWMSSVRQESKPQGERPKCAERTTKPNGRVCWMN